MRFLGYLDENKFPAGRDLLDKQCLPQTLGQPDLHMPGLRQSLTDVMVGQALYLLTGLAPYARVRDLRARTRGELTLGFCTLA